MTSIIPWTAPESAELWPASFCSPFCSQRLDLIMTYIQLFICLVTRYCLCTVGKCVAGRMWQQSINKNSISQQLNSFDCTLLLNSTTKIFQSDLHIRVTGFHHYHIKARSNWATEIRDDFIVDKDSVNVILLEGISSDLIQLPPGVFLHSADVVHVQLDPFINPTEQLPVEISEQALLLLKEERGTKFILEGEFCVVLTEVHKMPWNEIV